MHPLAYLAICLTNCVWPMKSHLLELKLELCMSTSNENENNFVNLFANWNIKYINI